MKRLSDIKFSTLDLVPVRENGSAAQSLHNSLDLAQHVEKFGYNRFWVAEHHNMDGIASSATSVLLGYLAGGTSTIRVGSGGVMLPNHAPLVIAEQFGTLESLYPGRIDLGLGRAPGSDQMTARALRRERSGSADDFPEDVTELMGYLGPRTPEQRVIAMPGTGTPAEAEFQHRRALQRLLLQQLAEPAKFLRGKLPGLTELGLMYRELGRVDALVEDILLASLDSCILDGEDPLPRDGAGLASLAERKRGGWTEHAERLAKLTLEILKLWHGLQKRFKGKIDLAQAVALNDIKQQLSHLVYPGFVRETPMQWLKELPRYLKAVEQRFEKIGAQVQRDRVWSGELSGLWTQYQTRANKHAQEGKRDPQLELYRWWLEEYRVSLFAQQLGTKVPISDKRLNKQWTQVEP